MKYEVKRISKFKKDYKAMRKRGMKLSDLHDTMEQLANGIKLPPKNHDHTLTGAAGFASVILLLIGCSFIS